MLHISGFILSPYFNKSFKNPHSMTPYFTAGMVLCLWVVLYTCFVTYTCSIISKYFVTSQLDHMGICGQLWACFAWFLQSNGCFRATFRYVKMLCRTFEIDCFIVFHSTKLCDCSLFCGSSLLFQASVLGDSFYR